MPCSKCGRNDCFRGLKTSQKIRLILRTSVARLIRFRVPVVCLLVALVVLSSAYALGHAGMISPGTKSSLIFFAIGIETFVAYYLVKHCPEAIADLLEDLRTLLRLKRISQPPGASLLHFIEFIYPKKTVERVFKPAFADLQQEYIEALAEGKPAKARWVFLRGILSVVKTMAVYTFQPLISPVLETVMRVMLGR